MKSDERKAAIRAYRERKAPAGIFAVRCAATGESWVGQSAGLDVARNRIWFTLGLGTHVNAALQAAWSAHGEAEFSFEALETLSEDEPEHRHARLLKERAAHWRETLGAAAI